MAEVKSSYLFAKFGNGIDEGFTAIPNILLDNQAYLNLSDKALLFIIKILRCQDKKRGAADVERLIKNNDLDMDSSDRTIRRIRQELTELLDADGNNLIIIQSLYNRDKSGKIYGAGTFYNFKPLIEYLLNKPTGQNSTSGPNCQNDQQADKNGQSSDKIDRRRDKLADTLLKNYKNNKNYKNIRNYFLNLYDFMTKEDHDADINFIDNNIDITYKYAKALSRDLMIALDNMALNLKVNLIDGGVK